MSINVQQFYELVICPTLEAMGQVRPIFDSEVARKLLLVTFCHESDAGTYLKQVKGPALGVYQMEPDTERWIWDVLFKPKNKDILDVIECDYGSGRPPSIIMISDLRYATIMCRLRYWLAPAPLPPTADLKGLVDYWAKYYQTQNDDLKKQECVNDVRKYAGQYFSMK